MKAELGEKNLPIEEVRAVCNVCKHLCVYVWSSGPGRVTVQKQVLKWTGNTLKYRLHLTMYRVVQKNGATLHFPKYLENY